MVKSSVAADRPMEPTGETKGVSDITPPSTAASFLFSVDRERFLPEVVRSRSSLPLDAGERRPPYGPGVKSFELLLLFRAERADAPTEVAAGTADEAA